MTADFRTRLKETRFTSNPATTGPDGRGWRVKREGSVGEAYIVIRMPNRPGHPPEYIRPPTGQVWDLDDALDAAVTAAKENDWAGAKPFTWPKFGAAKLVPPLARAAALEKLGINVTRLASEAELLTQPKRVFPIPNLPGLTPQWLEYRPRLSLLPKGNTVDPDENFQGLLPLFTGQPRGLGTNSTVVLRQGDLIAVFQNTGYGAPQPDFRRYLIVHPAWRDDCALAGGRAFAALVRHGQFAPWKGGTPTLNSDAIPGQEPVLAEPPEAPTGGSSQTEPPQPPVPALPSNYEVQQAVIAYSKGILAANTLPDIVEGGRTKFADDFFTANPVGQRVPESGQQRLDAYNDLMRIFAALMTRTHWFRNGAKPTNLRVIPSAVSSEGRAKDAPLVLTKGAPLLGLYEDGLWYPATFVRYNAKKQDYTVKWDDGGAVEIVEKVRPPAKLARVEPGMVVEVHYSDGGWYPAKVVSVMPGTPWVRIAWVTNGSDHGVEEDTTLDALRPAPEGTAESILDYAAAQNGNDARKLDYLQALWNQLNDTKFAAKMLLPEIAFMRNVAVNRMKGRGYWQASKRIIALNKRLFNSTAETVYEVLLHEMCHQAVSEIDFTVEREEQGHGPIWRGWMVKVGLDPRRYDPRENSEYMTPAERAEWEASRAKKAAAYNDKAALKMSAPRPGQPAQWFDVKENVWHVGRLVAYDGGKYKRWVFVMTPVPVNVSRVGWMRIPAVMLFSVEPEQAALVSTPDWDRTVELVAAVYLQQKEGKRARRTQARWGY